APGALVRVDSGYVRVAPVAAFSWPVVIGANLSQFPSPRERTNESRRCTRVAREIPTVKKTGRSSVDLSTLHHYGPWGGAALRALRHSQRRIHSEAVPPAEAARRYGCVASINRAAARCFRARGAERGRDAGSRPGWPPHPRCAGHDG